ncbi:2-succinyl-6-hydroxy-2,4-cyclohexadiene-1-carboxylate synthase [Neobacillus piezotolerans]|uniref:Putative 2-succinyl-6-hydroxy-2,4-cyclohexadiene-1-carboxylate synthase n=1 Tax=Neobacillus piezotolerans TaxID=2259171 RepID=A0A3D8GPE7_9BACI|nr:2-succinyl-6-hydroxy-2,4-cyclohexadiene-1-carboxylate synthase [Neobacillus piezotolerans]
MKIEGADFHVEMCGNGTPLLLLHGFTGSSGTWMPFCESLGRHSYMICPDLPGHGKTVVEGGIGYFSIDSAARALKEILDGLGFEKVDVLGYSMGGRLALAFALTYPDLVGKLVLESASPGLESEEERQGRRMKDHELANFIKERGIGPFVDYWENIPLFKSLQLMPDTVKQAVRKQRLENSPDGLANSLIGMGTGAQPSYWERLPELEAEVLLLAGGLDQKFCGIAERMSERMKSGKALIVEAAGHAIHVENPEKFGTIVSGFLTHT